MTKDDSLLGQEGLQTPSEAKTGELMLSDQTKEPKIVGLIRAATGAAISKDELVKSISHVIQESIKGNLLEGVAEAYHHLQEEGRIPGGYETTEKFRTSLQYLIQEFEGEDVVDERRFEALRRIFLKAAMEKDTSDLTVIYLLKICRKLTGSEILVLEAAHRLSEVGDLEANGYDISPASWHRLIARESPIKSPEVVARLDAMLIEKSLLDPSSAGGVIVSLKYRVSDLGFVLCKYIVGDNYTEGNSPL